MSGVVLHLKRQSEIMERDRRFCKKSLISGKRINAVPVFGVSRNKTLLVDSDQDSVVLAQEKAFRFFLSPVRSPLDQRPVHRLRDTVGSRFNEPLYNEVFIIIYIILFATQ